MSGEKVLTYDAYLNSTAPQDRDGFEHWLHSQYQAELAVAQELYRLANERIIKLLDERIAFEKQRDDLAAALDVARVYVTAIARDGEHGGPISVWLAKNTLERLADPAAILAARDKKLLDRICDLNSWIDRDHMTQALTAAPEAKP